jgi:hypothetical protein
VAARSNITYKKDILSTKSDTERANEWCSGTAADWHWQPEDFALTAGTRHA